MYCVRCKKNTASNDKKIVKTKNNRYMEQGTCKTCGTKKSAFVSGDLLKKELGKRGRGIFNDYILPNLPELHYFSPFYLKKHNFTGPGTKLDKRLDHNNQPKEWSKPINRVDEAAYNHDLDYGKYTDINQRRWADNKMIDKLNEVWKDKKADWRERGDALLVGAAMKGKRLLGLGRRQNEVGQKKK